MLQCFVVKLPTIDRKEKNRQFLACDRLARMQAPKSQELWLTGVVGIATGGQTRNLSWTALPFWAVWPPNSQGSMRLRLPQANITNRRLIDHRLLLMDSPQNNVITFYLSLAGTWCELRLNWILLYRPQKCVYILWHFKHQAATFWWFSMPCRISRWRLY